MTYVPATAKNNTALSEDEGECVEGAQKYQRRMLEEGSQRFRVLIQENLRGQGCAGDWQVFSL